jgi:hypothetical protein
MGAWHQDGLADWLSDFDFDIPLPLITLTIFCEGYRLWSSSVRNSRTLSLPSPSHKSKCSPHHPA